jgi:hypothetical protein
MPSGRTGAVSFHPQTSAYDENGATALIDFISALGAENTWTWFKATDVGLGINQDQGVFPPEVGGGVLPNGAYKSGYFSGGDFSMIPRLQNSLGYLFKAFAGAVAVTGDYPETGIYHHEFVLNVLDKTDVGLMALRRLVPAAASGDLLGETYVDCVIPRITLGLPQTGLITAAVQAVGRHAYVHTAAQAYAWAPSYTNETFQSAVIASRGKFEFPEGTGRKALGAQVDLINQFTTPQDERIVGSYVPENYTTIGRAMTISFTYKYSDPAMYEQIFYNLGNAWSPVVYTSSYLWEAKSPGNITGKSNPFRLALWAPKVAWQVEPVRLDPNSAIIMRFTGNILEADSGADFKIILENTVASYA